MGNVVTSVMKTNTKCARKIGNYMPMSIATAALKLLDIMSGRMSPKNMGPIWLQAAAWN